MEYVIGLPIVGLLVALAVVLFRRRMQIWGAVITVLIVMVLLTVYWSAADITGSGDAGETVPSVPAISGN